MDVPVLSTRSIRLQPRTAGKKKCHRSIVSADIQDLLKSCKKNLMITKSAVAGTEYKAEEIKKSTAMSKQKGRHALLSAKAPCFSL